MIACDPPRAGDSDASIVCDGATIGEDGGRFDIRAGRLRIEVKLRGAPLPMASLPRGTLVFRDPSRGSEARVEFGPTDPNSMTVLLAVGRYDVSWLPGGAPCGATTGLPCVGGVIARGVEVNDGERAVSFDLRPTRVVVTTTVNGAAAPAFELGSLILNCGYGRRLIGTMATPELDARAEVLMIPGKCDVLFEPGSCSPAGTLPCFPGVVREGVELAGDEATLAVDVRTARLRVSVDNAGSPLPDSTSDRGSIVIENSMLSRGVLVPRTGAATVDLRVVPGRYNIVWQGLCSRDQRSLVCGRRTIARDRMISADTEIRHSFSPVVVEGNLTSNGLPTAFHPMGDPTVLFVRDAQDVARALVTREAMATRYFVVLDAGEHEPWWGASGACGRERENSFQCVPAPLGPRRAWTADSVQDYNLTTVTQLFEVTIDGQPVPPAYSQIVLRRDGSSETTTIRSSMDAPLSVVMPPGTYSVDWSPGLGSFATSPRPASLPTFATHVARGVSITADGTQAIELRSLAYAAQLTINGADPPTLAAPTDSRGAIRFLHEGAFFAQSDLARTGPGAISAVIHRGSYSLWYSPPPCGPTIGVGQLCSSAPLFGCGR